MSLQDKFLTLAHAVEVFHRQMHDKTYVERAEYSEINKKLKRKVKQLIPSDNYKYLRKGIYESLNWANDYSLRDRLDDLREMHQHYSNHLYEEFDAFADDVVNTRNYLTHFVEKYKEKAKLDTNSMSYMCERLRFILEICLLSELGLNDEEMQKLVRNMGRINPLSAALHPPQPDS